MKFEKMLGILEGENKAESTRGTDVLHRKRHLSQPGFIWSVLTRNRLIALAGCKVG